MSEIDISEHIKNLRRIKTDINDEAREHYEVARPVGGRVPQAGVLPGPGALPHAVALRRAGL